MHVETHDFGGDDLTSSLVQNLQVTRDRAEELKRGVDLSAHAKKTEVEGQTYLWREVQEQQRQAMPSARVCHERLNQFFSTR